MWAWISEEGPDFGLEYYFAERRVLGFKEIAWLLGDRSIDASSFGLIFSALPWEYLG